MSRLSRALALLCLCAPMAPAASAVAEPAQPAPADPAPIAVVFPEKAGPNLNDRPIGAYRVPDSNVLVSGHQKGGGIGVVFGVAGLLAQNAIEGEAGKGRLGAAGDALHVDLRQRAADAAEAALKSGRYGRRFAAAADPVGATLTVTPFVVITFVSDTEARPYVVLKAALKPAGPNERSHTEKYFCCGGPPLALSGDNGLSANGGEAYRSLIDQELERAVDLMLTDVATPYARDDHKQVVVDAFFPFMRKKFKFKGQQLAEDEKSIVFELKPSAIVFSGVTVLDKATTVVTAK